MIVNNLNNSDECTAEFLRILDLLKDFGWSTEDIVVLVRDDEKNSPNKVRE